MAPQQCSTCSYWSELIAKTRSGVLMAMCLNDSSPKSWRYVRDAHGCPGWVEATEGAIDTACQAWPANDAR